jgi:hypothetical protein
MALFFYSSTSNSAMKPIGFGYLSKQASAIGRRRGAGVLAILLAALSGGALRAADLTLAWDASSAPGVVGYRLYYGQESGSYTGTVEANGQTSAVVPGLSEGATYFFAVSAYTAEGVESPASTEISYTVPATGVPSNLVVESVDPDEIVLEEGPVQDDGTGLGITEVTHIPGGGYTFKVTAMLASRVTILGSDDLRLWSVLGDVPNPTGVLLVRDPDSLGKPHRFYRLQAVPVVTP